MPSSTARVRAGIDRLLDPTDPVSWSWRGRSLGLVTNDVAVTAGWRRARTALLDAGYRVVRLFAPEHGLSAQGRDGARQPDATDRVTGLPVVSLYGDRFTPTADDLAGLDTVLFDLPDVGCQFYTYLWTMSHIAEACSAVGVPLVVLDRPNPLGGLLADAEGPMLDETTSASFIGRWRMPVRHSLTFGELARHWRATRMPSLDLRVVALEGWARDDLAVGSGRPWIPTSPAIPTAETCLLYPGTGLLEGLNVSDGRGTALPFRLVGAPWIDGRALARVLPPEQTPGIAVLPYAFTPSADKYAGTPCEGALFTVTDPRAVRPVAFGVRLLAALIRLYPDRVAEHAYRTAANPHGTGHLDRLLGIPNAFECIRAGAGEIITLLEVGDWADRVADALLY